MTIVTPPVMNFVVITDWGESFFRTEKEVTEACLKLLRSGYAGLMVHRTMGKRNAFLILIQDDAQGSGRKMMQSSTIAGDLDG